MPAYLLSRMRSGLVPDVERAGRRAEFTTTHWSVVLSAGNEASPTASEALAQLCQTYWYPIYAFIRRQGYGVDDARDLTQEFLARLIKKRDLSRVTQEKGRFRSFLLVALKHFLVNEWRRVHSQKRGCGQSVIPLDEVLAEGRYDLEPGHEITPERLYDRRWALTLLDKALATLRRDHAAQGKELQFDILKAHLSSTMESLTYAETGVKLGVSEGAVKVAVYRLRQRYVRFLREEIARTVATPADVDDELRYLMRVLSE